MPCFYCGKRVSIVRQLTDADFCSDEHRKKYHELTRMALNRLVESNEQASAPARRKGKGTGAAPRETAPIPEKAETQAPEAVEQPAPRRKTPHVQHVPDQSPAAPEKRPSRPHRQPPPAAGTPPPPAQPDALEAGFAALMQPSEAKIGDFGAPREGELLEFEAPGTVLPQLRIAPVFEDVAVAPPPKPAGWLARMPHASQSPAFLLVEPTPKRGPRPSVPGIAAGAVPSLAVAELIRTRAPLAAGRLTPAARRPREAPSVAFEFAPRMPVRAAMPQEDTEPENCVPQRSGEAGTPVAQRDSLLPALPRPVAGFRKPLTGLELRESSEARLPVPMLPGLPEPVTRRAFDTCDFRHALPMPAANRPRQTVLSASGRAAVRPMAMPGSGLAPERRRGLSGCEAPMTVAVPRACGAKPAPEVLKGPALLPAVSLPLAGRMSLATGLAASEPVSRRPHPLALALPPARLCEAAAAENPGPDLPVLGRAAVWRPAIPAPDMLPVASPASWSGSLRFTSLPCEELAGPKVREPELPGKAAVRAVPLASFASTGTAPVVRKAARASSDAPLSLPPGVLQGEIPIMLPPTAVAAEKTRLASAAAIPAGANPAPIQGKPKSAGWAVFAFDLTQSLAAWGMIAALRALSPGELCLPGKPAAKAPAPCPPSPAGWAFPIPEILRPQAPARFHWRIPETMPPVLAAPPQFGGSTSAPLGTTAALPLREPNLPAIAFRIPAVLSLRLQDTHPPGTAKAPISMAVAIDAAAPFRIEAIQTPSLTDAGPAFALPVGGRLPGAESVAARNVAVRPSAAMTAEFPAGSPSPRGETPLRGGACVLAGASAIAVGAESRTGAARPSGPESAGMAPAPAQLPGPQSVAASLALPSAGRQIVAARMLAGAFLRRPAGWEAVARESGAAEFQSLRSKFAIAIGATIEGGRFHPEEAPPAFAGMPRRAAAVSVEMLHPDALLPESTGFSVSLRPVPVCELGVGPLDDKRTGARMVRLSPVFRPLRRPARLPVFGRARIEKAGMPEGLPLRVDGHEDLDDYATTRLAAGAGACPVRMIMPASKRAGIVGKLMSADLIAPALPIVDSRPGTREFDYRLPAVRPQLPDGWVDTVPVQFDAAAVQAARSQNWEPLAGAVRSASRFFKFMCLALLLWTCAGGALPAGKELSCDGSPVPAGRKWKSGATAGRGLARSRFEITSLCRGGGSAPFARERNREVGNGEST